jgi:outer membrane cobalamin receptor
MLLFFCATYISIDAQTNPDSVPDVKLDEVVVTQARSGTVMSRLSINKTELITKTGLTKLACCNLASSFENSATVTVGFTDALSGAKQVQLLGLAGIYSSLQTEMVPTLRGLLSSFGWSYIPGTWLESIQISKGASSVVNGYEAISGQINLELRKPNYTDPLFINVYADHLENYEVNVTAATKVAKNLWTGLLLHGAEEKGTHDLNKDGFADMPKSQSVNLLNRWFYLNENGIQSRTNFRFLYDDKIGGQSVVHNENNGHLYNTRIKNRGFTVENKTGSTVGSQEGQSIGFINSFNYSDEQLDYGKKTYAGTQKSFHSNALYTSTANPTHNYTIGASFTFDEYNTWYRDRLNVAPAQADIPVTPINRREIIPGAFAEYTYNYKDKFTFIAGVREDYNSRYGWLFTPRTNIRYNVLKELVLRVSAGRGYRSPNVIADNIGILATSRKFNLDHINQIDIEQAWNYGGNISAYIPVLDERTLTVSVDYFHTQFDNQAIIDTERNPGNVYFYNLDGKSYADAWQMDVSLTPFDGFDIFAAIRYNDTKITYNDGNGNKYTVEKPLTSRYRGLINLSYATRLRKWVFDATAQLNGKTRLPKGYGTNEYSPAFPVYFAQITKNAKRFDIYVGSENLLDFKQKNPIISAGDPFGADFDASQIWGPVVGRKIYAGIRWRVGKLH